MEEDELTSNNYVWIPDPTEIFMRGSITDYLPNGIVRISIKNGVQEELREIEQKTVESCNPVKFNKCDDMAELTHLNEPSVIYNLFLRYNDDLIYTYSGLFLVAINPYKKLSIYDSSVLKIFHELSPKNDEKLPPHIFAIAEISHRNLLANRKDQSILVTGESGAGKTENTKKIIQYLSQISMLPESASVTGDYDDIHDKILRANPILESFGNAKTIKNNNSSRFGKFIKIFFDTKGYISGATIDYYLLEKSRVTHQSQAERNYHVFYQILNGMPKEQLSSKYHLVKDYSTYKYLSQSMGSIPQIDDMRDFHYLNESFRVMGFSEIEISSIFSGLAIILHLGNLNFSSWKADQASFAKDSDLDLIADLLGVNVDDLSQNLLKPKVKAGREFVHKSQKASEVKSSIDGFAKHLYEKVFQFIIDRIDASLMADQIPMDHFIGVLDIAGFEIFEINSFEQLCINYTNEKLQQFFNHHSFILEQSEYLREDIQWEYIDFGLDLQPTIDLIETKSPMGILEILDEQCILPKASEKTFMDKLLETWCGCDTKQFRPNKVRSGFIIDHYAGLVEYDITGWLQKNRDPVSGNITTLMTHSKNNFIGQLFSVPPDNESLKKSRNLSPKLRTVSQKHKEQLSSLMNQLSRTEPHFVRCILPNLNKKSNKFDKELVLHQLRCNGVLEGIRIARAGYPNKMNFDDFYRRYSILNRDDAFTKNSKSNCELILKNSTIHPKTYKIGITKLFFKNGILGSLEELRDATIKRYLTKFQSLGRGQLSRTNIKKQIAIIQASRVISRNLTTLDLLVNRSESPWLRLFIKIKPLLEDSVKILDTKALNHNLKEIRAKLKETETAKDDLELQNTKLNERLYTLEDGLMKANKLIECGVKKLKNMEKDEAIISSNFEVTVKQLSDAHESSALLAKAKSVISEKLEQSEKLIGELKGTIAKLEAEKNEQILIIKHLKLKLEEHAVNERAREDTKNSIHLLEEQCNGLKSAVQKFDVTNLQLKDTEAELENARSIIDGNVSALADLETNLRKVEGKNDELVKSSMDQEIRAKNKIKSLEADKMHLNKNIEIISSEKTVLEMHVKSLKQQLEQLGEERLDRMQEVNVLAEKLNAATEKSVLLESKISEMGHNLNTEIRIKIDMERKLDVLSKKLSTVKDAEERWKLEGQQNDKIISELKRSKDDLARRIELQESALALFEQSKTEIQYLNRTNNEYSHQISSLQNEVHELQTKLEHQESLRSKSPTPSPDILCEYATIKARLSEQSAIIRTERFENQKLLEEICILRKKVSETFESHQKKSETRRSMAIGDQSSAIQIGDSRFSEEARELKIQLKQEEANALRAENYAIELQKRLNKLQATRGINTFTDYEFKYKDSQRRVEELEQKIVDIISDSSEWSPDDVRQVISRSNSLGSVNPQNSVDFAKIYSDINSTLRTTREELSKSKSEILRLKSLLRESEDELYDIKKNNVKSSVRDYEQQLARLKIDNGILAEKHKEVQRSLEKYKTRSEEYYEKLELAESAVTISKRLEVMSRTDLEEKNTELKLTKEEVRVSEKIIKQLRHTINEIEKKRDALSNECKRSQNQVNLLQERIDYLNTKYSDQKTRIEQHKDEIRSLSDDVKFRLEKETEIIKQNKRFKIDNDELLRIKEGVLAENTKVAMENKTLSESNKTLQINVSHLKSEKEVHERKIIQCSKQINSLRDLLEENGRQIMDLTARNQELEHDKDSLENEISTLTESLSNTGHTLRIVQEHAESIKVGKMEVQQEAEDHRKRCEASDMKYKEARNENLVVVQENESLKMVNSQLTQKLEDLESKLYSNEQLRFLEGNASRLNDEIDILKQKILDGDSKEQTLRKKVSTLEYDNESRDAQLKKYNDENFNYQNMIGQYKGKIEYLFQENAEKDLKIKAQERALASLREKCLLLETEGLAPHQDALALTSSRPL